MYPQGEEPVQENRGLTAHELVQRQIQDPDYHVTEEDIANLNITEELSEDEEIESETEAEDLQNDKAGTSYDVLD